MTREEAIAVAERFSAAEGLTVGPVCDARYFSGDEFFDCEIKPPSHWSVYFAYTGPQWEESPEERRGLLSGSYDEPTIIIVEEESGKTNLFMSL